jgi:hypothetical protein
MNAGLRKEHSNNFYAHIKAYLIKPHISFPGNAHDRSCAWNPGLIFAICRAWIPAFAGMTVCIYYLN